MNVSKRSALVFAMLASAVLLGPDGSRAQNVRVRLLDLSEPVTIKVSAHESPLRLYAGTHEAPLTTLEAGQEALVSRASKQLHVVVDGMGLYAESIRAEPDAGGLFGITIEEGAAKHELRRYDGRLNVSTDGTGWEMKLVNEVSLESYVASVVASEYGFDDVEGSKAMAVLVRTYALGVSGKAEPEYDHVDHTLSQVYPGADRITPVALLAVRSTKGEVLTHDGQLIRAVYFSSSGGHTADNETVWEGQPLPYLRGKSDPYGRQSPHSEWTSRISRSRLLAELRAVYGPDVDGFMIGDRSDDGRVTTIDLVLADGSRQSISGNDFRLLVTRHFGVRSLRSTLFDARRTGDEYLFEGRGFGHGVGLSQWGAHDMAGQGMSYKNILDFYYSDVALAQMDDVPRTPAASTAARTAGMESVEPVSERSLDPGEAPEVAVSEPAEAAAGIPEGAVGREGTGADSVPTSVQTDSAADVEALENSGIVDVSIQADSLSGTADEREVGAGIDESGEAARSRRQRIGW